MFQLQEEDDLDLPNVFVMTSANIEVKPFSIVPVLAQSPIYAQALHCVSADLRYEDYQTYVEIEQSKPMPRAAYELIKLLFNAEIVHNEQE